MRDCPACRVPLHGYEDVCPSCGTKQLPSRSSRLPFGTDWKPPEARVNMVPFVLFGLAVVAFFLFSMQSTWIGQLMRQKPQEADPLDKLTFSDARAAIDADLQKNLASIGAKNTQLHWHAPGAAATGAEQGDPRTVDGPIELTVTTTLPTPDSRKEIVDPVKPYFEKAKLFTLELEDSKSHAHWTYTMAPPTSAPSDDQ